jgi:hypothetical protein
MTKKSITDHIAEAIHDNKLKHKLIESQCQKYTEITCAFDNQLYCVQAPMGSGKTYQIEQLCADKKILMISSRRTFSNEISRRLGLRNYMEIDGSLNVDDHPRLVVQIDSIHRV